MKLIDVPLPLDAASPLWPDHRRRRLESTKRVVRGRRVNVSTLHMSAHRVMLRGN
jgi:kynurenine formamidase